MQACKTNFNHHRLQTKMQRTHALQAISTSPPFTKNPPPILKINRKNIPYKSVLSVDGGGLLGVIPLTILIELEKKIKSHLVKHKDILLEHEIIADDDHEFLQRGEEFFNIQLADFFDYLGGVSAGSIITSFLAVRGRGFDESQIENGSQYVPGSPKICRAAIVQTAPIAFNKEWYRPGLFFTKYSCKGITDTAIGTFSKNLRLSQVGDRSLIIAAFKLDDSNANLFYHDAITKDHGIVEFERNPNIFTAKKQLGQIAEDMFKVRKVDFELWQAVRSSAAAPTYFPSYKLTCVEGDYLGTYADGGVIINNIDYIIMTYAAIRHKIPVEKLAVLSLGCGEQEKNLAKGRRPNRGALFWVTDLIAILLNSAMHVNAAVFSSWIYMYLMEDYPQYLRIQPIKGFSSAADQLPQLDDVAKLNEMIEFGEELCVEYSEQLDIFVEKFLLGIDKLQFSNQANQNGA